jgi:hypothetical protein
MTTPSSSNIAHEIQKPSNSVENAGTTEADPGVDPEAADVDMDAIREAAAVDKDQIAIEIQEMVAGATTSTQLQLIAMMKGDMAKLEQKYHESQTTTSTQLQQMETMREENKRLQNKLKEVWAVPPPTDKTLWIETFWTEIFKNPELEKLFNNIGCKCNDERYKFFGVAKKEWREEETKWKEGEKTCKNFGPTEDHFRRLRKLDKKKRDENWQELIEDWEHRMTLCKNGRRNIREEFASGKRQKVGTWDELGKIFYEQCLLAKDKFDARNGRVDAITSPDLWLVSGPQGTGPAEGLRQYLT